MTHKQARVFLEGEGKAWFERNKHRLPVKNDPVLEAIKAANIRPTNVVEVGCADGWRLRALHSLYGCSYTGIDPAAEGCEPHIYRGTADDLWRVDHQLRDGMNIDMVIYGFCLYLADREDLFRIAMEGDRILADGGHIVVYDFHPEFHHSREYSHKPGIQSYKMDYSKLWLANPAYSIAYHNFYPEETSVTILKKNVGAAWPKSE